MPIARTHAPATEQLRVVGDAWRWRAEVQITDGAADVAARASQILPLQVLQVAVRKEIVVGIGPGPVDADRDVSERVRPRIQVVGDGILEVPAAADFDRRLAVAEHVPRHAASRRQVVITGHPFRLRNHHIILKELVRRDPLFGEIAVRVVVSQRALIRQPADRPLLLDEERGRTHPVLRGVRSRTCSA